MTLSYLPHMTRRKPTLREFIEDSDAPHFARRMAEKVVTLPFDDGRRIFMTALFRDRGEVAFVETAMMLKEVHDDPDNARWCLRRILDNKYATLRDFRALSRHVFTINGERYGPTSRERGRNKKI